jgi:acyl carrier protein
MNREHDIKNRLSTWVAEQSSDYRQDTVPFDLPIIEQRIITSVQIMELILYLEHLRGEPINPMHIKPGAFSSIDAIYQHFFAEGQAYA